MSAERKVDPTRGRKKKQTLSEIAEKRQATYNPHATRGDKYWGAIRHGVSVHKFNRRRREGDLPPAIKTPTGDEWLSTDLSAMSEMEQLGIWAEYWKPLRQAKGERAAWVAMLGLLKEERERLKSEGDEALRLVKQGGIV